MSEEEQAARLVRASVQRALLGQTPATLRAYSFAIDHGNQRIHLRAHFGEIPSEADLEALFIIEAEIEADFPEPFEGETVTEVVAAGATPSFLAGGIAYLREGEPGTIRPV